MCAAIYKYKVDKENNFSDTKGKNEES